MLTLFVCLRLCFSNLVKKTVSHLPITASLVSQQNKGFERRMSDKLHHLIFNTLRTLIFSTYKQNATATHVDKTPHFRIEIEKDPLYT